MTRTVARRWIAVLAACLVPGSGAWADDAGTRPDTIVLGGILTDHNPFQPGARRDGYRVTVFLEQARLRVDFAGPSGERGLLLHDLATGTGWLADLGSRRAIPVDASAVRSFSGLVVDPSDPCADLSLHCAPAPPRLIAGSSRRGYRFRDAAGRGPGGLSDGEFWVDASLGVVLAYRATGTRARKAPALQADFALLDAVPASYFELPDVDIPDVARRRD